MPEVGGRLFGTLQIYLGTAQAKCTYASVVPVFSRLCWSANRATPHPTCREVSPARLGDLEPLATAYSYLTEQEHDHFVPTVSFTSRTLSISLTRLHIPSHCCAPLQYQTLLLGQV